jgi:hypothetical protein
MKKLYIFLISGFIVLCAAKLVFPPSFDFISEARQARWQNDLGKTLPFPGSDSDSRGFVRIISVKLENGRSYSNVLQTHPRWANNGGIEGHYRLTIPEKASFEAEVGFVQGATGSDGVIFEICWKEGNREVSLKQLRKRYTRRLRSLSVDLSNYAGHSGMLILRVKAGPSSGQDWAVWKSARIITAQPPPTTLTGKEEPKKPETVAPEKEIKIPPPKIRKIPEKVKKIIPPIKVKYSDLIIDEIKFDRENRRIGYVIKNVGKGKANAGYIVALYIQGKEMAHDFVNIELQPGATYDSWFKEYQWREFATAVVKVWADSSNQMKESNEQNNFLERTFEYVVDVTPPKIIKGPIVTEVTQTSAVIYWETDEDSDSLVRYDNRAGKYNLVKEDSNLVKKHFLTLPQLKPLTIYHFIVESKDSSSNKVRSRDLNWKTLPPTDRAKPTLSFQLPDKLSGKIPITAYAQDNVDVDRVVFTLDGKPMSIDYSAPFEWECETGDLTDGFHNFGAQVFDSSGNSTAIDLNKEVQNRFPVDLSPIHVYISSPRSRDEVEIDDSVWMEVEVTHDNPSSAISRIEAIVIENNEEHIVWHRDYTCREIMGRLRCLGEPPVHPNIFFTISEFELGLHNIKVIAYDLAGNQDSQNIVLNFVEPEPTIAVRRDVHAHGNWFDVKLTLRNTGVHSLRDFQIRDACIGFQAIALPMPSTSLDTTVQYSASNKESQITIVPQMEEMHPGDVWEFHYYVVPILFSPPLSNDEYIIGRGTWSPVVLYTYNGKLYQHSIDLPYCPGVEDMNGIGTNDLDDAFNLADYLIVTNPTNLLDEYSSSFNSVYMLLQEAATLAKAKNGILGYLPSGASKYMFKNLINEYPQGRWNEKLAGPWNRFLNTTIFPFIYLLIVGETNIVPSFTVPTHYRFGGDTSDRIIPCSDFPYADIRGNDSRPELSVGRIVGNDAEALIRPIRASINVHLGLSGHEFDRFDALLESGGEGTWEQFVDKTNQIGDILSSYGTSIDHVRREYYTTEVALLREALVIRGDFECTGELEGTPPRHVLKRDIDGNPIEFCSKTHPPMDLASLHELISVEEAIQVQEERRDGPICQTYDYNFPRSNGATAWNFIVSLIENSMPNKDIYYWNGHGGPGEWTWFTTTTFDRSHPIVFSNSCQTGKYEGRSGAPESSFQAGAAIFIGATQDSIADSEHGFEFARKFFAEYWRPGTSCGDALTNLKDWMWTGGADEGWRYTARLFNLYGDPKYGR